MTALPTGDHPAATAGDRPERPGQLRRAAGLALALGVACGALAGCSQAAAPASHPARTRTARVTCAPGIKDITSYQFYSMAQIRSGQMAVARHDMLAEAYQVTVTAGSAPARLTAFTVVIHGQQGKVLVTRRTAAVTSIPSGESLTWVEHPWGNYPNGSTPVGPLAAGGESIDRTATCRAQLSG